MYRVYLRDFQGRVPVDTKTNTPSATAAAQAFAALVNRTDLDGQKLAAVLSYNNVQMAFHRFDRFPGQADYWRDRLGEIDWPGARPVMHGGSREGSGRPKIGAQRVNVSLDEETLRRAREIGAGNVSEGLRRAVAAFTPPDSSP